MHPLFQDYLDSLTDLHQGILNAIEGLPSEALDWTPLTDPTADMNSINVLVTHLCGAERYWIGDVAAGDPSGRIRDEEFQVSGLTAKELTAKVDAATEYAQSALERIYPDTLHIEKSRLLDDQPVTAGWALLHALEHTAIHLGHIQITRQLWDERD